MFFEALARSGIERTDQLLTEALLNPGRMRQSDYVIGRLAIGAQRKHVTLPTDFRFPLRQRSFRTTAIGRQGLALQLPSNKSCK